MTTEETLVEMNKKIDELTDWTEKKFIELFDLIGTLQQRIERLEVCKALDELSYESIH